MNTSRVLPLFHPRPSWIPNTLRISGCAQRRAMFQSHNSPETIVLNPDLPLPREPLPKKRAPVCIATGYPCCLSDPPTETDGPLGALAIARALSSLGKKVVILTDQVCPLRPSPPRVETRIDSPLKVLLQSRGCPEPLTYNPDYVLGHPPKKHNSYTLNPKP
jgi:hypothetical protein